MPGATRKLNYQSLGGAAVVGGIIAVLGWVSYVTYDNSRFGQSDDLIDRYDVDRVISHTEDGATYRVSGPNTLEYYEGGVSHKFNFMTRFVTINENSDENDRVLSFEEFDRPELVDEFKIKACDVAATVETSLEGLLADGEFEKRYVDTKGYTERLEGTVEGFRANHCPIVPGL